MTVEDDILTRIDLHKALEKLHPADREMILLIYRVAKPDDWGRLPWPPRFRDIGLYVGLRYEGRPLSEAAVRYRRDVILAQWEGRRGALRRHGRPPAGRVKQRKVAKHRKS